MFSRGDRAVTTEPAEHGSTTEERLTREQVVGRIIEINPTATRQFLDQFGKEALGRYLDHLVVTREPRGRTAVWERLGDTPAITHRSAST